VGELAMSEATLARKRKKAVVELVASEAAPTCKGKNTVAELEKTAPGPTGKAQKPGTKLEKLELDSPPQSRSTRVPLSKEDSRSWRLLCLISRVIRERCQQLMFFFLLLVTALQGRTAHQQFCMRKFAHSINGTIEQCALVSCQVEKMTYRCIISRK
jgi:hypothetical protein